MFDDVGICLTYSPKDRIDMYYRAQTDPYLMELLEERWALQKRTERLSHKCQALRTELEAIKEPKPGNFAGFNLCDNEKEMLTDAYKAVTAANAWQFLKTYTPENGFMFSQHPVLEQINTHMTFKGHSGSSYGFVMRTMEAIAKNGWASVKRGY
jgi:hypothetical protein